MFGIGMPELIIIFFIALIILGPKRLPEVARGIGKGLRAFKRALNATAEEENDSPEAEGAAPQQRASGPSAGEGADNTTSGEGDAV